MKCKLPENCCCDDKDVDRGFLEVPDTHEMDDGPTNSLWQGYEEGGFLGRAKGLER